MALFIAAIVIAVLALVLAIKVVTTISKIVFVLIAVAVGIAAYFVYQHHQNSSPGAVRPPAIVVVR